MGIGDLTEDCCLRQRKEKLVIFSCLPCTHGHGSRSSHMVHSFLTYSYSNVLCQNAENYYFTKFTTGTPLAATSQIGTVRHHNSKVEQRRGGPAHATHLFPSAHLKPCFRSSISIAPSLCTESPSFHETQGRAVEVQ